MYSKKLHIYFLILLFAVSCFKKKGPSAKDPGEASSATGVKYDKNDTTFHPDKTNNNKPFEPEKLVRPNMVFIEGGRTLIGFEEFEMTHSKTRNYTATVESFYMDETEIANIHWLEYLFFLRRASEEEYIKALPDTMVWMKQFSFNDFYVENYLRHPAFRFYPVVGVSWLQANDYCKWRSDPKAMVGPERVEKEGTGKKIQLGDTTWIYEGYKSKARNPREESKLEYRLPTEAEWIYASQTFSYMEPYLDEKDYYKRVFPWDGSNIRNPYAKKTGYFFANYKRGRGDYDGIAGNRNDGAVYTEYIYAYPPNDVGLYNIAGNVNEWVQDLYEYIPKDLEKYEFNKNLSKEEKDILDKEVESYEEYLEEERYRVYKGGSWNDNAYWLSPFTRRFFTEDSSSSTIGFRCVMNAFPTEK